LSLNLKPVNNNATVYNIAASFEDTATPPLSATAWAKTLDGQDYAACTTVQYGYKPAYNTTTLTVLTGSSEVMTTTMSPEDAQKEAEESGALTIWHEFSWWYPWYRLHIQFSVNGAIMHAGFNPLFPSILGGNIVEVRGLGNLTAPVNLDPGQTVDELIKGIQELFDSSLLDVIGTAAFILAAGNTRMPLIIYPALIGYAFGLFDLGYYAFQNLYNAGAKNAGKAFMAGLAIGLACVFLTTIFTFVDLSKTSIIFTSVISAILGTLLGNLCDPQPMSDLVRTSIAALLEAAAVAAIGLRLPEPMGNAFAAVFLSLP
jgi:hypothetical protein